MDLSKQIQKADEAVKRRNWALAISLYQSILDLDPNSGEARLGLRKALDGKFEGKKGGGNALSYVGGFLPLLSAGFAKLTKGHAARARNLERFLVQAPHHVGANLGLGDALWQAGHLASAYVVYRHLGDRILEGGRQGKHAEVGGRALRAAGACAQELGQFDDAAECFEAALELNPRDQEAQRARKNLAAEGQLGKGGFATAGSSRELLKDAEQTKRLEQAQRKQHRSADELGDALKAAKKRLADDPDDASALRDVGELSAKLGKIDDALDHLERALIKTPDDANLAGLVAELQVREAEGDLDRARKLGDTTKIERLEKKIATIRRESLEKRVAAHPTDLGLRHQFGEALFGAGEFDAAIAEFQRSVKDPRHSVDARIWLGRAFRAKGLDDLAKNQLEEALEAAGPKSDKGLELLYELGCLAADHGNSDEARRCFGRILEVNIGYKDAATRLEALGA
ncbi:MAG: tetratricopeptide repeat protein [Planctomycetes bacterium]|nr:tetratricopeptide repeat protein [Planctomycetota bacterium]